MNDQQNGLGLLDILTMLSFILQLQQYQDRVYLDRILDNQKQILAKLADLSVD